jgi:hypothetical protein
VLLAAGTTSFLTAAAELSAVVDEVVTTSPTALVEEISLEVLAVPPFLIL